MTQSISIHCLVAAVQLPVVHTLADHAGRNAVIAIQEAFKLTCHIHDALLRDWVMDIAEPRRRILHLIIAERRCVEPAAARTVEQAVFRTDHTLSGAELAEAEHGIDDLVTGIQHSIHADILDALLAADQFIKRILQCITLICDLRRGCQGIAERLSFFERKFAGLIAENLHNVAALRSNAGRWKRFFLFRMDGAADCGIGNDMFLFALNG